MWEVEGAVGEGEEEEEDEGGVGGVRKRRRGRGGEQEGIDAKLQTSVSCAVFVYVDCHTWLHASVRLFVYFLVVLPSLCSSVFVHWR